MKIGPKFKIAKRLGAPVFPKTQTQKFALSEARGGRTRKRRPGQTSDYKRQLIEKQKMRYLYNVAEKHLRRYVNEAITYSSQPAETLLQRLEYRLDNVVFRLGLAKSRQMARQMVSHGHITVNDRKLNVPSHKVAIGDNIAVRNGSKESIMFTILPEQHEATTVPSWLSFDLKNLTGSVKQAPAVAADELLFDTAQVLEYYSR